MKTPGADPKTVPPFSVVEISPLRVTDNVREGKKIMLAEAEPAMKFDTTLADLVAEALLLEEEQETQQAAKKKAKNKHKKR